MPVFQSINSCFSQWYNHLQNSKTKVETFAITQVTKILCSISFSKCKTFLIFPTFCSILGGFQSIENFLAHFYASNFVNRLFLQKSQVVKILDDLCFYTVLTSIQFKYCSYFKTWVLSVNKAASRDPDNPHRFYNPC